MERFSEGDVVKSSDADAATSVPAYRKMRGRVVQVSADGRSVRVDWYDGETGAKLGKDVNGRSANTIVRAT